MHNATLLQLHGIDIGIASRSNMSRRLPDLKYVVFCRTCQVPFCTWAPGQIANFGSMPSVDEQQLGRTILGIVWRLFGSDRIEVPDVDSTISSGRGKVDGRVGGPSNLKDVVGVAVKGVEFEIELSDVPEGDGLTSAKPIL